MASACSIDPAIVGLISAIEFMVFSLLLVESGKYRCAQRFANHQQVQKSPTRWRRLSIVEAPVPSCWGEATPIGPGAKH